MAGDVDGRTLLRLVVQSHTAQLIVAILPPNDRVGPLPGMVGLVELFVLGDSKNVIGTCVVGLKICAVDIRIRGQQARVSREPAIDDGNHPRCGRIVIQGCKMVFYFMVLYGMVWYDMVWYYSKIEYQNRIPFTF